MGACSDLVGAIPTSQHPLVPFISMPPSISRACFGCGKASSVQLFATPTETHRSPSGHSSLQSKSLLFLEPFCARKLPAAPFTHALQRLSGGGHLHHLEPFSSSSSASALQNLTAPQAEPEEDVGFLQVLQGVARVILHCPKGDEHLPAATHGSQSSVQPGKASGGLMRWLPFNVTAVISFVLLR